MDWIVEKATEAGVSHIVVTPAERSVTRLSGDRLEKRLAKLRETARAAAEQCGRNVIPSVDGAANFDEALRTEGALRILLAPGAKADAPRPAIEPGLSSIVFAVGPERGLFARRNRAGRRSGLAPDASRAARFSVPKRRGLPAPCGFRPSRATSRSAEVRLRPQDATKARAVRKGNLRRTSTEPFLIRVREEMRERGLLTRALGTHTQEPRDSSALFLLGGIGALFARGRPDWGRHRSSERRSQAAPRGRSQRATRLRTPLRSHRRALRPPCFAATFHGFPVFVGKVLHDRLLFKSGAALFRARKLHRAVGVPPWRQRAGGCVL